MGKKKDHDDLIAWTDVDLDAVLGEYMDMEARGHGSSEESEPGSRAAPQHSKSQSKQQFGSKVSYVCPLCDVYRSIT